MTRYILYSMAAMASAAPWTVSSAELPAQLQAVQGDWATVKTNRDGQRYFQNIKINQDRLTFTISSDDGQPYLTAKGKLTTDKLGPFNVWKLSDIEAARAGEDPKPVSDDHVSVYTLRGETLFVAASFDKERENQEPRLDVYTRGTSPKAQAGPDPAAALAGNWKLDVELGENSYDYELRISRDGPALAGVLVSPRSGEHKIKSVAFKDGKLTMEIVRDLQGNEATFVYQGALKDGALAGSVTIRGFEDQVSGKWTAKK